MTSKACGSDRIAAMPLPLESMPASELPDFHIPHAEKIEWMIETHGYALEAIAAQPDADPPIGSCTYTIGFPEAFDFPDVVVFGLTPAAAGGLLGLFADMLRGGTEIPIGVEVVGLFDGEQRALLLDVDVAEHVDIFATALAWYRSSDPSTVRIVQLLWPDRNGFLPNESGFDARLRWAQPVIGTRD